MEADGETGRRVAAAGDLLSDIKSRGYIRVGTFSIPPECWIDIGSGEWLGIDADFTKAIAKVVAATRKHGKALGRLVPTVEQGVELHQGGFDFICYSGDVWVLHNALAAAIGELRAKCRRN